MMLFGRKKRKILAAKRAQTKHLLARQEFRGRSLVILNIGFERGRSATYEDKVWAVRDREQSHKNSQRGCFRRSKPWDAEKVRRMRERCVT